MPSYRRVRKALNVLVKVPKLGTLNYQKKIIGLKPMEGFMTDEGVVVDDYHLFGHWFPKEKVVLNKCFHGLQDGDFGQKKVFRVEVFEKETETKTYTLLNYYRQPDGIKATTRMQITHNVYDGDGNVQVENVLNTDQKICFISRRVRKQQAA